MTSDECDDKNNEKDACLLVEFFVGSKGHKEKNVAEILNPISLEAHHKNINQNKKLDVR